MSSEHNTPFVRWRRITLVERFESVFYPLDVESLLGELPNLGYIVPATQERLRMEGGSLALRRDVAVKGHLRLVLNQDAKTLGIEGRDALEVLEAFRTLRQFCEEHLHPSSGFKTAFLELTGVGFVVTGRSTVETFSRVWANSDLLKQMSEIVGEGLVNRGIHLVSPREPENPNWVEIGILPVPFSELRYHVEVVWRDRDGDLVMQRLESLDSHILKIINTLEAK